MPNGGGNSVTSPRGPSRLCVLVLNHVVVHLLLLDSSPRHTVGLSALEEKPLYLKTGATQESYSKACDLSTDPEGVVSSSQLLL